MLSQNEIEDLLRLYLKSMGPALYGSGSSGMSAGPMVKSFGPTGKQRGTSGQPDQMYANPFDALIKADYQNSPKQQYETKTSFKYKG